MAGGDDGRGRCPGVTYSAGYTLRRELRCQLRGGHVGKCFYHRKGSQGGTTLTWWGVNTEPVRKVEVPEAAVERAVEAVMKVRGLVSEDSRVWATRIVRVALEAAAPVIVKANA